MTHGHSPAARRALLSLVITEKLQNVCAPGETEPSLEPLPGISDLS